MNTVELYSVRANPAIDPNLAIWNWEIPVYLFLGGLVAGIMVITAVQELRKPEQWERRLSLIGALTAVAALSVGMLALFLDLTYKLHVYRFYLIFKPESPMSWGSWILILAYPALLLLALGSISDDSWHALGRRFRLLKMLDLVRRRSIGLRRPVLLTTALAGVGLGTYTGILLSAQVGRPLWTSGLLGPLFLASGVSAAAAFLMLLRQGEDSIRSLRIWDLAAISVEVVLLGLFIIQKLSGSRIDRLAAELILAGPYAGAFFGMVVMLGLVTPFMIEMRELRLGAGHAGRLAPILVLIGGLSLRAVFVAAGQVSNYSMVFGG